MRATWAMAAVLVLATACGKAEPEAAPVLVQHSQVDELVYWSGDLDGKRVSFDGYLNFNQGRNGQAAAMGPELRTRPNGDGDKIIFFHVERGEGPNQLHLPVLKTESIEGFPGAPQIMLVDITNATYQDATGEPHPLGSKMRVTGKLVYARAGKAGLVGEDDFRSPSGKRFKPRLVNVEFAPAPDA